jgi:hypothetical protein
MIGPSIEELKRLPGITLDGAMKIKIAMHKADGSEPETIDAVLSIANDVMHGHGVEPLFSETCWVKYYGNISLLYVNMGDTYTTTFCYDVGAGVFSVQSFGSWAEAG